MRRAPGAQSIVRERERESEWEKESERRNERGREWERTNGRERERESGPLLRSRGVAAPSTSWGRSIGQGRVAHVEWQHQFRFRSNRRDASDSTRAPVCSAFLHRLLLRCRLPLSSVPAVCVIQCEFGWVFGVFLGGTAAKLHPRRPGGFFAHVSSSQCSDNNVTGEERGRGGEVVFWQIYVAEVPVIRRVKLSWLVLF